MKKITIKHKVRGLQKVLDASMKKDREIGRLRRRLLDQREVARERQEEMQTLFVCKVALAAVVSNYFAAKMGNRQCQGQMDETLKMAADVLLIADPNLKDIQTFCGAREARKRAIGGKPS